MFSSTSAVFRLLEFRGDFITVNLKMFNVISISVALVLFSLVNAASEDLRVVTSSGPVRGIEITTPVGNKVQAYLGIPFGQPPVGDLRFKPPVPVQPWTDTLQASTKPKGCIQVVAPREHPGYNWWLAAEKDTSEDCLFLNVWVPSSKPKDAAVMVWIHGGAFEGGSSALDKYDGQILSAIGDVIVVSVNYRLSVFGFLYLGSPEIPGNVGLMDQALGLKWVRKNIKSFGGDPSKVTIIGESAGGASVTHHLTIPSSRELFQRVISQSGTSNAIWASHDKYSAYTVGESIVHSTGCSTTAIEVKDIIDCLRKLDVKTLVTKVLEAKLVSGASLMFGPVVDGSYIPDTPQNAIINNETDSKKDVLLGATTDEGSIFMVLQFKVLEFKEDSFITAQTFSNIIRSLLKTDDETLVALVQHSYTDWENPDDPVKIREQVNHFFADLWFLCKINVMSDLLVDNGNKVFRYQFAHHPSVMKVPSWMGCHHGDELDFIFGKPLDNSTSFIDQEKKLATRVIKFWSNFAKYGNPNGKLVSGKAVSEKQWPQYSKDKRLHLSIGLKTKVRPGRDLRIQQCALWEQLVPKFIAASHAAEGRCNKV